MSTTCKVGYHGRHSEITSSHIDTLIKMNKESNDDEILGQKGIDIPGLSQGFFVCNQQLSLTRVLREVKRHEHSVTNCIASIVHDVSFVREVHERYSFPVCGNKRCGAWYTGYSTENDTCYFKSTDGHVNQWSFSMARLNLHVAMYAIDHGGCIVVDATRRGKKFPDSLSKTVPIWAAVVTTCVLLYQMDHCLPLMDDSEDFLCLPKWIPEQEQMEIEKRIDLWATQLYDSGVEGISRLATVMRKPLRCCWVHATDGALVDVHRDFPTLVLVSASLVGSRERKMLSVGNEQVIFEYIPGAGDDEESWARGLTPSMMWDHYEDILQSEDSLQYISALVSRNRQFHGDAEGLDCHGITWFGQTGLAVAPISYVLHNDELQSCAFVNISRKNLEEWVGGCSTLWETRRALCGGGMTVKDSQQVLHVTEECPLTRHIWIHDVAKKNPIIQCAPAAIEFASIHLTRGRKVVFVYDAPRSSIAVGLLLGTLIACFDIPQEDQDWHRTSSYSITNSSMKPAHASFSRDIFKTYVAKTTAQYCPHIIMSKSILKQVFNLFIPAM